MRAVFVSDTQLGFDYALNPRVRMRHGGEDFFANFERVLDHAIVAKADLLIEAATSSLGLAFRGRF